MEGSVHDGFCCCRFGHTIKIVHFIGESKPWHFSLNTATGQVEGTSMTLHNQRFLQMWWSLFLEQVQPHLDPKMVSSSMQVRRCMRMTDCACACADTCI